MTTPKSLPVRPSLDSLRKQAKKLSSAIAAGDTEAIARARAQLPNAALPLSLRDAQLVLAREYGYAGWRDLVAEVNKRLGNNLEWAATQARHAIHNNDIERLKQLLAENPALLAWTGDDGGLLGFATNAYGDSFDPAREQWFTRAACAELLIDSGAIVTPSTLDGVLSSRARGVLQLFWRKGLLPRSLKFSAALGEIEAVRSALSERDLATVNEAFMTACRFEHEEVASLLLERSIALDADLGRRVDESMGRSDFVKYFIQNAPTDAAAAPLGPWQMFAMEQAQRSLHDRDLTAFVQHLQREPWLLGETYVEFQARLIETAAMNGGGHFVSALFELNPAILQGQPPPRSQAIECAFTYASTHLLPLLTRIWPVPDDLPHAAGMGNVARVKQWFDKAGAPALGDLNNHYPYNDARARGHLRWDPPTQQQVLDTALAFSVINSHFDVADFLLEHGANINTNWNSHEQASILHHLVFLQRGYEPMQFLIDRGIDMTIKDYRWNSTAQGWAVHALKDEKMAQWLDDAERRRTR